MGLVRVSRKGSPSIPGRCEPGEFNIWIYGI